MVVSSGFVLMLMFIFLFFPGDIPKFFWLIAVKLCHVVRGMF